MPRKAQNNVQQMDDQVIRCYIDSHGREVTTQDERRDIAERWCRGDFEHHIEVAGKHELPPIALLIAALIDMDHPLLCSARGVVYNSLEAGLILTDIMLKRLGVAQPVQEDSFHTLIVERI